MSNNHLSKDKQIAVTAALAEGNSIRSIERMTGIHRDTIMRLGVRVGQGCAQLLDQKMRNLDCNRIELDEIWGFIGKKVRHLREDDDPTFGDVWTYCAMRGNKDCAFVQGCQQAQSAQHNRVYQ
jgi:hypothetical protein